MTCLPKGKRLENRVTSVDRPHLSPWLEPANGTLQAQLRGMEASGNNGRFEGNFWCLNAPPATQLVAAFLHTPCFLCEECGRGPNHGNAPPDSLNLSPQESHPFLGTLLCLSQLSSCREHLEDEETTLPRISSEKHLKSQRWEWKNAPLAFKNALHYEKKLPIISKCALDWVHLKSIWRILKHKSPKPKGSRSSVK